MDISRLILDDHNEQRRRFAILEQIDSMNTDALGAIWERLAAFLEMHAAAEEKWFYPALLKVGQGAGSKSTAAAETRDAIGDHNDIRDAVKKVANYQVGSDSWYSAIAAANKANSDHMGEEERESLADFRRHATLQQRHDLAVKFATFEAVHFAGVEAKNKDAERYIERNE
ncbi:MAG: hemerythrin domain-containing protein [Dokdonella sp.]